MRLDKAVVLLVIGEAVKRVSVECCGEDYVAEYARRIREMIKTYRREREGRVFAA